MAPVHDDVRRGGVLQSTRRTREVQPQVRSHPNARHRSHRGCVRAMVIAAWEPDCYPGDRMDAGVALRRRARGCISVMFCCVLHRIFFIKSNRSKLSPPPFGGTGGGLSGNGLARPGFAFFGIRDKVRVFYP